MSSSNVLVTGGVGFIGMHLSNFLKEFGYRVTVLDNCNPAYGNILTKSRLSQMANIELLEVDLCNLLQLRSAVKDRKFSCVIHLAGWPGVGQSMVKPFEYIKNNILAFNNLLEILSDLEADKFLYASSSSVLGKRSSSLQTQLNEDSTITRSLYAVTKLSMENIAQSDTRLSKIQHCGLRFFSVVGSFGRPDMAYWIFIRSMLAGLPLELRGEKGGQRDYTDVNDLVRVIQRLIELPSSFKLPPFLDIGSGVTFATSEIIETYENVLQVKAKIVKVPTPDWEMIETKANNASLKNLIGHFDWAEKRNTFVNFARWYMNWTK